MKSKIVYDSKNHCFNLLVTGFSLSIGNNYTLDHLVSFLFEQNEAVIDLIRSADIGLDDFVTLCYKGSYGKHKDIISMSDLSDYLRHYNKIFYG